MSRAAAAAAGVGAVAEQTVRTRRAVRIGRRAVVGRFVARLRAVAVAVRARAWIAGMGRATAAAAGVGAVAEQAVRTRRAVRIGRGAVVGAFVARFRAVAVAVRARTRIAGVDGAGARAVAGVGAVAEQTVGAGAARRLVGMLADARGAVALVVGAVVAVVGARRGRRSCTCSSSCSTIPPCR